MEIIEATAGHVPGIIEVWKELMSYHERIDDIFLTSAGSAGLFEGWLRECIANPDFLVLAAVEGGEVAAFSMARIVDHPPVFERRRRGDICDMAVVERFRGTGIGDAIVGRVKEWFVGRGVDRVELRVAAGNELGYRFWREQGFTDYLHTLFLELDGAPTAGGDEPPPGTLDPSGKER